MVHTPHNNSFIMPKIAELADYIIDLVADELDVPKDAILSK